MPLERTMVKSIRELYDELNKSVIEFNRANYAVQTHKGNVGEIAARAWRRKCRRHVRKAERQIRRYKRKL